MIELKRSLNSLSTVRTMVGNIASKLGTSALVAIAMTSSVHATDLSTNDYGKVDYNSHVEKKAISESASLNKSYGSYSKKMVDLTSEYFMEKKELLVTKDNIEEYLSCFDTDSENIIVIIDKGKHAKGVIEIAIKNIKDNNLDADIVYIPYNTGTKLESDILDKLFLNSPKNEKIFMEGNPGEKDFDNLIASVKEEAKTLGEKEIGLNEIYEKLGEVFSGKKVVINESFSTETNLNDLKDFNFGAQENIIFSDKIQKMKIKVSEGNPEISKILKENKNLFISKASGNSQYFSKAIKIYGEGNVDVLAKYLTTEYFNYAGASVDNMTNISGLVLDIIETEKKFTPKIIDDLRRDLLSINPKIPEDSLKDEKLLNFINLNVADYIVNIGNMNKENFSNFNEVKAIDREGMEKNMINILSLNKSLPKEERYKFPKEIKEYYYANKKDVSRLETIIEKYKDSRPELFIPSYSSPLFFSKTNGLEDLNLKAIGQYTQTYNGYMLGTSEATPNNSIDVLTSFSNHKSFDLKSPFELEKENIQEYENTDLNDMF